MSDRSIPDPQTARAPAPARSVSAPGAGDPHPRVLLVDDGGLEALAALAVESDPAAVLLWHPPTDGPAAAGRRRAAARHAAILGGARAVLGRPRTAPPRDASRVRWAVDAGGMLAEAAGVALDRGCRRIVWPVAVGPEADDVARAAEIAECVMDLVRGPIPFGGAGPGVGAAVGDAGPRLEAIELPFVDLADDEVLDLALDGGMPDDAFWPCAGAGERPCGGCPSCGRWRRAFAVRGRPWPWSEASRAVAGGSPVVETVPAGRRTARPRPGGG